MQRQPFPCLASIRKHRARVGFKTTAEVQTVSGQTFGSKLRMFPGKQGQQANVLVAQAFCQNRPGPKAHSTAMDTKLARRELEAVL